jgi:hypothetical protein
MATATDFTSTIGQTGLVGSSSATLTNTPVPLTEMTEMVPFSRPIDQVGGTSQQTVFEMAEHTDFSEPMDTQGSQDHQSAGADHAGFDSVPLVYKMKGWSTTLGQYVYWSSVGNPFTPPPAAYGTVINTTSELMA